MVNVDIIELAQQERNALQAKLAEMDAFISMGLDLMQRRSGGSARPADLVSSPASGAEEPLSEDEPLQLWPNQARPHENEEPAGVVRRNLMRR